MNPRKPTPAAPLIETQIYVDAFKRASRHRAALEASGKCACFFCFKRFPTGEIRSWVDAQQTALCPHCGLDSVLDGGEGHRIDDTFLRKMHQHHYAFRSK